MLDDELKWCAHIDLIYSKLVKFTSIFYKLRSKLPPSMLQKIYFAFVHPHILYGIELYANTYPTHLDKLMKLNNKILRILQNKPILTPVLQLYVNYNTLPIGKLHIQQLLVLVHKFMHHVKMLPDVFSNYFLLLLQVPCIATLATMDFHLCLSPVARINSISLADSLRQEFKLFT